MSMFNYVVFQLIKLLTTTYSDSWVVSSSVKWCDNAIFGADLLFWWQHHRESAWLLNWMKYFLIWERERQWVSDWLDWYVVASSHSLLGLVSLTQSLYHHIPILSLIFTSNVFLPFFRQFSYLLTTPLKYVISIQLLMLFKSRYCRKLRDECLQSYDLFIESLNECK
jgi:hypothetical protein